MPASSELQVLLTLNDQLSARLASVKTEINKLQKTTNNFNNDQASGSERVKKGNESVIKSVRDQIQPLSLLLRTVARVGFIWSVTFGVAIAAVVSLGKEIQKLDTLSAKLGISASDLSKRFYGFDITTQESRAGVEALQNTFFNFEKMLLRVKMASASVVSEIAILSRQAGSVYGGEVLSREAAIQQITAENKKAKVASPEGQAAILTEDDLYKKLSLSKVEYTRQQFESQLKLLENYGIETARVQKEFDERERMDRTLYLVEQEAIRLNAEGNVTRGLYMEQVVQMQNLKKVTNDKLQIESLAKTQRIQMEQQVTKEYITTMQAYINALTGLQSALAGAAELGRSWGYAAQALNIALAVMNTAVAITEVWKVWAWNPPVAESLSAIVMAAGAIQIATIAATKFHEGGAIYAHSGLAVDEVPIIAQTGEGILSRRGMDALGGAGALNSLNSGRSGRGGVYVTIENASFSTEDAAEETLQRLSRLIDEKSRSRIR